MNKGILQSIQNYYNDNKKYIGILLMNIFLSYGASKLTNQNLAEKEQLARINILWHFICKLLDNPWFAICFPIIPSKTLLYAISLIVANDRLISIYKNYRRKNIIHGIIPPSLTDESRLKSIQSQSQAKNIYSPRLKEKLLPEIIDIINSYLTLPSRPLCLIKDDWKF